MLAAVVFQPARPSPLAKKSRSTVSSPIFLSRSPAANATLALNSLWRRPNSCGARTVPPSFTSAFVMWAAFLVSCGGSTTSDHNALEAADGSALADASAPQVTPEASTADGASPDGSVAAAACIISASQYDTSCSVDSDCVGSVGIDPNVLPILFGD